MENTNTKELLGYALQNPDITQGVDSGIFTNPNERELFEAIQSQFSNKLSTDVAVLKTKTSFKIFEMLAMINDCMILSRSSFKQVVEVAQQELKVKEFNRLFVEKYKALGNLTQAEQFQALVELKESVSKFNLNTQKYAVERNPALMENFVEEYSMPVVASQTGIMAIDTVTGGLRAGNFVTILANSGVGKTNLMLNIAGNMMAQGKKVLYISLEMSTFELMQRLVAMIGDVSAYEVKERRLNLQKVMQISDAMKKLDVAIVSTAGITSNDVVELIMEQQANHGVDVVMVDYLQRLNDGKGNDVESERITRICRRLKNAAMNLGVPIITPSQVDKESAKGNYIGVENAVGSKSIGDESDLALYLYYKNNGGKSGLNGNEQLYLKVVKNRHGETGRSYAMSINPKNLRMTTDDRPEATTQPTRRKMLHAKNLDDAFDMTQGRYGN